MIKIATTWFVLSVVIFATGWYLATVIKSNHVDAIHMDAIKLHCKLKHGIVVSGNFAYVMK